MWDGCLSDGIVTNMDITFANQEAQKIYRNVLSNTPANLKNMALELFSFAANEDGNKILSEEEARDLNASIDRYSCKKASPVSIENCYSYKITKAHEEYRAWRACLKIFDDGRSRERVKSLETFSQKYTDSKYVPEALFRLQYIFFHTAEFINYDKAKFYGERLFKLYPSSPQTSQALADLIDIYFADENSRRALELSEIWLKRPPYRPRDFFHPSDFSYGHYKNRIRFFMAEHYRSIGNINKTKSLLLDIVNDPGQNLLEAAQGGLFEIERNPKYKEYHKDYLIQKAIYLGSKGDRFLYDKGDLSKAEKVFGEILAVSKAVKDPERFGYITTETEMILEEIRLRRAGSSTDALKLLSELIERGRLNDFVSYLTRRGNLFGVSPELLTNALILNSFPDVHEVRVVLASRTRKVDEETKTIDTFHLVMFKNKDGWNVLDDKNILNLKSMIYREEDAKKAISSIEAHSGFRLFTVSWRERLFARSMNEAQAYNRFRLDQLTLDLENQRISVEASRMLRTIFTTFRGREREKERSKLLSFAKAFSLLPQNHFFGLRGVTFVEGGIKRSDGTFPEADYNPRTKEINFAVSKSSAAVHEIVHHWDFSVAVDKEGKNLTAGDPSVIFYRISWNKWSEASCGHLRRPCGGWERKSPAGAGNFANTYGTSDGYEDLATSAESYVEGTGELTRPKVRKQMAEGNFTPAAKYLFNKYVRSYDKKDGLCFEYNVSPKDPPLTLTEVKSKLKDYLNRRADPRAMDIVPIIMEIEKFYSRSR